ncbi:tRNA pseudouridine55 synthase [Natronospira proteinivora]|uniref:tRNA pseudouridine synthase B n=1 Tax=Natronospira proteinivora TaxID=1807133 RepID=A0ABT1G6P2_9GAMM|nr:tRNA pseudouridine(55) synthase TruB [Natronospira proteinivora]MCP1726966.1 tRNA pseudouridine55 synthase [Natronospira proteinivora]
MARRGKRGRDVHGILPLDKPLGESSNHALQRVKRLYQARKAGHTGSLDPLASGVLPLCFGEATKLSAHLLDSDKHYDFHCRLGQRTATGDTEGEVLEEAPVPALDEAVVESALAAFRGDIQQIPPMYSAIKHQGERLYRLAREGREVERDPRPVRILSLELLAVDGLALQLRVCCSKGTYVRVLAEDIARELGTVGHVSYLRRIAAGPYTEKDLVTLAQLEQAAESGTEALDSLLQPLDTALPEWSSVQLSGDAAWYFGRGNPVMSPGAPPEGRVKVYGEAHRFLGIGEILEDGRVAPRRLLNLD